MITTQADSPLDGAATPALPVAETPVSRTGVSAPPSGSSLRRMAGRGEISADAFEAALRFLNIRPGAGEWAIFFRHILSLFGALLLASGIIFFFAWNWMDMRHFTKFGLLFLCIFAAVALALFKGLDSPAGKVALLFAGLMVGPLLAVYGQSYQTGAEGWELFRIWALLLIPLALASRQTALWCMFWLVAMFGGGLYYSRDSIWILFWLLGWWKFVLPQFIFLALWEAAAWRWEKTQPWLVARWLPRLVFFFALACLTTDIFRRILFAYGHYMWDFNTSDLPWVSIPPPQIILYLAVLIGTWFWFRKKRPDLFMLGCGILSLCTLLICLLIRARFLMSEGIYSVLAWGILIAAITAGAGKILHIWHQGIEREQSEHGPAQAERTGFFVADRTPVTWDGIWAHLRSQGLLAAEASPVPPSASEVPWYVLGIQALGGWVASVLLLIFLGLFVVVTLDIDHNIEAVLLGCGVVVLIVGMAASRARGIVGHQFGLACSLAGAGALSVGLAMLCADTPWWPLAAACGAAAAYPLVKERTFRLIAATAGFALIHIGIFLQLWGENGWLLYAFDPHEFAQTSFTRAHIYLGCWWLILCMGLAWAWLKEKDWIPLRDPAALIPPALHGLYISLPAALICLILLSMPEFAGMPLAARAASALGVAAGCGIGLFAWFFGLGAPIAVRFAWLVTAALIAVAGWFMPGMSVALLGLATGRHIGNKLYLGGAGFLLFCYLIYYYYDLNGTLLDKSINLMISGAVILFLGIFMPKLLAVLKAQQPADGGRHA